MTASSLFVRSVQVAIWVVCQSLNSPARTKYQSGSWGHSSLKVPVLEAINTTSQKEK